jgi:F-type H+-transporting ATPase subunit a
MDSIFPQVLFSVFGIPVRDTVVSTWIMMVLIVGVVILLRKRLPALLEMYIDFINDMASDIMGISATPFIPLLGTLALFIAVANNFSILPVVVSPTKDINTPLALALVVFFAVHYYGIREKGVWGYFKSLASPIFMLPIEVIGQLSRTMSLTLRLFGNIISGELVVGVIFMLVKPIAPLPLVGLGLFTGVLQAYIFTVLVSGYIASAVKIES